MMKQASECKQTTFWMCSWNARITLMAASRQMQTYSVHSTRWNLTKAASCCTTVCTYSMCITGVCVAGVLQVNHRCIAGVCVTGVLQVCYRCIAGELQVYVLQGYCRWMTGVSQVHVAFVPWWLPATFSSIVVYVLHMHKASDMCPALVHPFGCEIFVCLSQQTCPDQKMALWCSGHKAQMRKVD